MSDNPAVIEPGDQVELGPPSAPLDAIVLQVCRAMNANTYEVAWWDSCQRRTAWVHEIEIRRKAIVEGRRQPLGFNAAHAACFDAFAPAEAAGEL